GLCWVPHDPRRVGGSAGPGPHPLREPAHICGRSLPQHRRQRRGVDPRPGAAQAESEDAAARAFGRGGARSRNLSRAPELTLAGLGWLTTVDHKRIGILYGVTAFAFFLIGGLEALLMRLQLARPEQMLVEPDTYNALFTMHGTTMIFLAVMPLTNAFVNYIVPLMLGARDVAFP